MEHEIYWGALVALYLFLAGAGAGANFISSYFVLDGKIKDTRYLKLSFLGAMAGFLLLLIGTMMIVLDLTSFRGGLANLEMDKLLRFYKLFMVFVPNSIMSLGTWLLFLSIPFSFIFALSLLNSSKNTKYRVMLARINMILSIFICSYTAFLLGDITHNIVWNNSVMVILFMVSSLSCGVAVILFLKSFIQQNNAYEDEELNIFKIDSIILFFEILCAFIFAYVVYRVSDANSIKYVLNTSNNVGLLWWLGAIGVGLVLPLIMNMCAFSLKKKVSHLYEFTIIFSVLIGAFCLRYSILVAGQIY